MAVWIMLFGLAFAAFFTGSFIGGFVLGFTWKRNITDTDTIRGTGGQPHFKKGQKPLETFIRTEAEEARIEEERAEEEKLHEGYQYPFERG